MVNKAVYNYCVVLCDRMSRFPVAFCLSSLNATCVCNALVQVFLMTGIHSVIQSECGTKFTSKLTRTFLQMLGCSPRVNVTGRPQQSGLVEGLIDTLGGRIGRVAADHPESWHANLGCVLWVLRGFPSGTAGAPSRVMVCGGLPRGPLVVLKESWCGFGMHTPCQILRICCSGLAKPYIGLRLVSGVHIGRSLYILITRG